MHAREKTDILADAEDDYKAAEAEENGDAGGQPVGLLIAVITLSL